MANSIWIGKRKRSQAPAAGGQGPVVPRSGQAAEERQRAREEAERELSRAVERQQPEGEKPETPRRHTFSAEVDLTELDSRYRPGLSWTGRAVEISRSHVAFRSRRMCYEERRILVAVHLIDAVPVPLYGEVIGCEYDGEGLYRTELALMCVPELDVISDWIASRAARGSL